MGATKCQMVNENSRWQARHDGVDIGSYASQDKAAILARAASRDGQPSQVEIRAADVHPQSRKSYPNHRQAPRLPGP